MPIVSKGSLEMTSSKAIFLIFIGTLILLIGTSYTVIEKFDRDGLGKNFVVYASSQQNDGGSQHSYQGEEISKKYFEEEKSTDLTTFSNSSTIGEAITGQDSLSRSGSDLGYYESQSLGFKIAYPVSWQRSENSGSGFANVIFISPLEGNEDKFNERLAVRISSVGANATLRSFSDTYISNIRNNPDTGVVDITGSSLSGNPAEKLAYILRQGEKQFGILEQWTVKNNRIYQLSFYSELEKYESYLSEIEDLINSFEIF
jgi:hypothetical protein